MSKLESQTKFKEYTKTTPEACQSAFIWFSIRERKDRDRKRDTHREKVTLENPVFFVAVFGNMMAKEPNIVSSFPNTFLCHPKVYN